jgi:hypothetical protein
MKNNLSPLKKNVEGADLEPSSWMGEAYGEGRQEARRIP